MGNFKKLLNRRQKNEIDFNASKKNTVHFRVVLLREKARELGFKAGIAVIHFKNLNNGSTGKEIYGVAFDTIDKGVVFVGQTPDDMIYFLKFGDTIVLLNINDVDKLLFKLPHDSKKELLQLDIESNEVSFFDYEYYNKKKKEFKFYKENFNSFKLAYQKHREHVEMLNDGLSILVKEDRDNLKLIIIEETDLIRDWYNSTQVLGKNILLNEYPQDSNFVVSKIKIYWDDNYFQIVENMDNL